MIAGFHQGVVFFVVVVVVVVFWGGGGWRGEGEDGQIFWKGSCVTVTPCATYTEDMFVTRVESILVPEVMLGTI